MQVEHDELTTHLVFPSVIFPTSYPMTEQNANHTEHRFSVIALRRINGEALREPLSE